ncbi:cysteine-rich venom protein-like [Tubulanus polymorphus]|uniref:cysteine-rich venom protein-like n=1 Tax=Tubulanus polymorphus TaxID=672921 RepID=UPI003DA5047C
MKVVLVVLLLFAIEVIRGQKLTRGLTNEEKQRLLDIQNLLRARIAVGKTHGQPSAANMLALEWDDRLMEQAQDWADSCSSHMHNEPEDRRFGNYPTVGQNYFGGNTIDRGVLFSWYGEVKHYHYYSNHCSRLPCGHYTQVAWAESHLVGCGYNDCKGQYKYTKLYCNYATGANSPWTGKDPQPYLKGKPCSKCPANYAFCMDGALCASKRACDNSESKCECTIKECKNGGVLDEENCKCKCPDEWEGALCEEKCVDIRPECAAFVKLGYCEYDANTAAILTTLSKCRKTCGFCGSLIPDDPGMVNSNGFKTSVKHHMKLALKDPSAKHYAKPTLPPRGFCPNNLADDQCDEWARYGSCKANPEAMRLDCAGSCNMCDTRVLGQCPNKANNERCERWALAGRCNKDREWMHVNCARSCDTCNRSNP